MLSERHKEDLESSGINNVLINEIGFYTADSRKANELLERRDINCDCLVIPYPGIEGYVRLKPDGIILNADGKPAKYLQKSGSESRLFLHKVIREQLISLNGDGTHIPLLFTEGEKKALKLTQEFFFAERLFYTVGISGVWNWRTRKLIRDAKSGEDKYVPDAIGDIKSIPIDNRVCYICFDSDIINNEQVQEAENELGRYLLGRGATRVACIRIPHESNKLGADDYLVRYGNDRFKELLTTAKSNGVIKYVIKLMRKFPNMTHVDKIDMMVTLILKDLGASGSLYYDNNGSYFFSNISKTMEQIEEDRYAMRLADEYGLYRDTSEFKNIISKVEESAIFKGEKVSVKNFSFFDKDSNETCVYNNSGGVFRISSSNTDIRQEANGFNKIFFKHRDGQEPIIYYPNSKGYFEQYILDYCNFQYTEFTNLSPDQQRFLFTVWFYSLFFPNLLPTKPILVMTGDYGSGKSTIQRLVGKLLFGSNFNVSTIQGERDFLTSIINKYYLVYDNADINEEWVRNAIASLSTGFKVEVRKLYSNMEMFQADPIAYLAMNSMGQGLYKRPDIASRLLIFRTKALQKKIPETILLNNVLNFRNFILSEVFDNLREITKYIDDKFTYTGNFRMADFANVGFKIATSFGRENEFKHILDIVATEQATLPLEDNPIVDLLDKWLNKREEQAWISTGELYGVLKKISDETKMFFPFKSSVAFGRALQLSFENLKYIYSITNKKGGGNKIYWLITYNRGPNGKV